MQEISNLTVYTGIIPNKATQTDNEFANNIFGFLNYSGNTFVGNFNTIIGQFNVLSGEINTTAEQITLDKQTVLEAKDITLQAKDAALISKNEAAAIYDNFDDRYLGTKSTPPTLDNDDEPLRNGALYCKESLNPEENGIMYVYDLQLGDWVNISFVPTLFTSLTDILFNGLANGDILKYDAALGKWKNIPRDYYKKDEIDSSLSNLNDDIEQKLSKKAPLVSPNFTDSPSAPTPSLGDNSTKIATTAFVLTNADKVTSEKVGLAIAGISAGGIGSYALLSKYSTGIVQGSIHAGSSLRYSGFGASSAGVATNDVAFASGLAIGTSSTVTGTWMACFRSNAVPSGAYERFGLFLRIA